MQEKEKQGANPVENKVLLYSGKPRVSEDREGLGGKFRRITLFQVLTEPVDVSSTVCFGISGVPFLPARFGSPQLGHGGYAVPGACMQLPSSSSSRTHVALDQGSEAAHGLLLVWRLSGHGCFPSGFEYQSLPNGIPESVDRGRGRNNFRDKLHCVGGWRLSEWPQEGVRQCHVVFEELKYQFSP